MVELRKILECKSGARIVSHYIRSFNCKIARNVIDTFRIKGKRSRKIAILFLSEFLRYFEYGKRGTDIFDYIRPDMLPKKIVCGRGCEIKQLNMNFLDLIADTIVSEHLCKFFCNKYCIYDLYDVSYIISRIVPMKYCKLFFLLKTAYLIYKKYEIIPTGLLAQTIDLSETYDVVEIFKFLNVFLFSKCLDGYLIEYDGDNSKYVLVRDKTESKIPGIDFLPNIEYIVGKSDISTEILDELTHKYSMSKYDSIEINIRMLEKMYKMGKNVEFIKMELFAFTRLYVFSNNKFDKLYEFIMG